MAFYYSKHMISVAVVCMTLLLFSTSSWPQPTPVYALQLSEQSAIKLSASSGSSPFFLPSLSSSQSNSTNSTTAAASVSNFLTYQNSTYGISVQHPSNWIREENHNATSPGRIVKFSSPQGTPRATLNIIGGNRLPLNMSLEQFSAASINNLRQSFPRFNLLESSSTTLGGFPAHRAVYTAEVAPGFGVKFMQVWTIKDARDFIITEASLPSDFSNYLPTIQHMIDSFAFIPTTAATQPANNATTAATQPANNATTATNQTGSPSVANRTAATLLSNRTSLSSILPFTNKIFNGSSLSGIVGISSVTGVKVTGVNLVNNEISVTLRHILTTGINNVSSVPPSVTVTIIRLPMSLKDLMSLAAASGSMGGNSTSMKMTNNANPFNAMIGQGFSGVGANAATQNNPLKALAFLKNIQIGSSSILKADWRLPQTTTMGLIGASNGSSANSTADFVIVTVVPYTGKTNNLTG
ncbi:MAG: hypothetical protein DLM72_06950 [Candidatus Nitrosopolaris wilkensis]|nr:MAG: hypothetical protein DLM72_06950 [Candidatus Nitrosopolaris wilkensis]